MWEFQVEYRMLLYLQIIQTITVPKIDYLWLYVIRKFKTSISKLLYMILYV